MSRATDVLKQLTESMSTFDVERELKQLSLQPSSVSLTDISKLLDSKHVVRKGLVTLAYDLGNENLSWSEVDNAMMSINVDMNGSRTAYAITNPHTMKTAIYTYDMNGTFADKFDPIIL